MLWASAPSSFFFSNKEKSGPHKDKLHTHIGTSSRLRPVGRNERASLGQYSVDPRKMALHFLVASIQGLRNLKGMAPVPEAGVLTLKG